MELAFLRGRLKAPPAGQSLPEIAALQAGNSLLALIPASV
jgi:hypothetical protein